MKPIRVALLMLTLAPFGVLAAPPDAQQEAELEAERQMRTARVVGLSEALELDTAQALQLAETLRKFDERRRPLRQQVRESAELLQRAARGDTAAMAQVDQAAQKAFDARAQLTALDREMFQALSKDMPPQKRAKLALFMARFESRLSQFKTKYKERMRERMQEKMRKLDGRDDRG
ncbi:hypothetical protein [Hyalangium versicolor]|uniref:hypothetical protein n=1 Tax=Hyalangium versicolor TaxID=2861190 RepID=UPI001CCAA3AA|nr:hypothetical protein [Hyalangium versicolor]